VRNGALAGRFILIVHRGASPSVDHDTRPSGNSRRERTARTASTAIVRARQCTTPFDWGADTLTAAISPTGREIFDEAARYGIRYGCSIPVPTEAGPCVVVTFATDERRLRGV
jgi:hypothetical protein